MKAIPRFILVLAALGVGAHFYAKYNSPRNRLARAQAALKAMEREARRDVVKMRRTKEQEQRLRYMPLNRFPKGTSRTGRRVYQEKAYDELEDTRDWFEDRQAALEAQRELVKRLEAEVSRE